MEAGSKYKTSQTMSIHKKPLKKKNSHWYKMLINEVAQLRVVTSRQIEKDRLSNLLLYLKNETFLEMVGYGCIENNKVKMLVNIVYSHVTLLKN
jgi:hypothetical protein